MSEKFSPRIKPVNICLLLASAQLAKSFSRLMDKNVADANQEQSTSNVSIDFST